MDDLISRQAAIDALGQIGSLDTEADREYAIEVFQQLPSARQWIPRSERLPESNKEVLVFTSIGGFYIGAYEPLDGIWYETVEYRHLLGVTAWMPLPEPYKEKSDG